MDEIGKNVDGPVKHWHRASQLVLHGCLLGEAQVASQAELPQVVQLAL